MKYCNNLTGNIITIENVSKYDFKLCEFKIIQNDISQGLEIINVPPLRILLRRNLQ